jgi:hypothetical protein
VSSAAFVKKRCWNENNVLDGKGVGKMARNCLKNLLVIRTEAEVLNQSTLWQM